MIFDNQSQSSFHQRQKEASKTAVQLSYYTEKGEVNTSLKICERPSINKAGFWAQKKFNL